MRKIKIKKKKILIRRVLKWHINYYLLKKPFPLATGFYITNKCNLHCNMCNIWRNKDKSDFNKELFFKTVDQLKGCYYLSFTGGDPLLHKDIMEMITYSKKKIPFVHLVTNGTTIDKNIAAKLAETKINEVSVSIDGFKETHDKIRGKGSYDKAINAVKLLKQAGVNVVVNTIISPSNIDELPEFTNFIEKLRVGQQFQPIQKHPTFKNQKTKAEFTDFDNEFISKSQKLVKKLLEKKNVVNSKYYLTNIPNYFKGNLNKGIFKQKCINPSFFIEFKEDNKLYPCLNYFNWQDGFPADNGIKKIFKSKDYKNKLKEIKNCKLCQKDMFVCYIEPRIVMPITNYLVYNLGFNIYYKIKNIFKWQT